MTHRVWLLASAVLIASSAHAAPLTFDAALRMAGDSAPSLQAREHDVRAAQSASIAAGRLPDPKFNLAVEGFPISGPTAWRPDRNDFSDLKIGIMQDVPNGASRRAARERASADIDAARAGQSVEALNVRLSAALSWIDLYYAERRLAALDEIEAALKPIRETAPAQVASGGERPGQSLAGAQASAALEDRRADLQAQVGKARATLARWTGDSAPDVSGDPPDPQIDEVSLRAGLDHHPSILAFAAMEQQADADVASAEAAKRPDWGFEASYMHRDPMFGDLVSLGVTMSLPIFPSTRQDPVIDARVETASGVRLQREAALRELRANLDSDLADHAMHHARLHTAADQLVPLAKQKSDLEVASYAAGKASLDDVLQALLALAEARIDLLDRDADEVRDRVRINLTYGADAQ